MKKTNPSSWHAVTTALCRSNYSFRFLGITVLSMFILVSSTIAQTISTAAGSVTWTLNGTTNITEVTLVENGNAHGDGLDGGMAVSVTGTNITFSNSYHLSSQYGAAIQHVSITNTGGTASTFTLSSTGNLGSDGNTRYHYTSSSGSRYTISSDNVSATTNGSDPVISILYGNAALNAYTTSMPFTNLNDATSFTISNVPIPAGATRRFLFVLGVGNIDNALSNRPDQALVAIQKLATGAWPADFSSFLTAGQKTEVMNWSAITTLPVTWQSFTVQPSNEKALLKWSTASEQNTKSFIVQHSENGVNWTSINEQPAMGNSNSTVQYTYLHSTPSKAINYYRILQTDLDGKSSYSKILILSFATGTAVTKAFPNPVTNGQLIVQLPTTSAVRMYNQLGVMVFSQKLTAGTHLLNIQHLARGHYKVQMADEVTSIVIQ
jgi:Secretion system C-terminal sorting domain